MKLKTPRDLEAFELGRADGKLEQDSKLFEDGYKHGYEQARRETAREWAEAVRTFANQGTQKLIFERMGLEDGATD